MILNGVNEQELFSDDRFIVAEGILMLICLMSLVSTTLFANISHGGDHTLPRVKKLLRPNFGLVMNYQEQRIGQQSIETNWWFYESRGIHF